MTSNEIIEYKYYILFKAILEAFIDLNWYNKYK